MKSKDLSALLIPYNDAANILADIRICDTYGGKPRPLRVPPPATVGKLRTMVETINSTAELLADVRIVDERGREILIVCKQESDSHETLLDELDDLLSQDFAEPEEVSVMPDFDALDRQMQAQQESDEERLGHLIKMNGTDRNPVVLDFKLTSIQLPQDNEDFMRRIYKAAATMGCTLTYAPVNSCFDNHCSIKLADGKGFFGYQQRVRNEFAGFGGFEDTCNFILEHTDGRRYSASALAADYENADNGRFAFDAPGRIEMALRDCEPDDTDEDVHERIHDALTGTRVKDKTEVCWSDMKRKKGRRGKQCWLFLENASNACLNYQIAYQYPEGGGKIPTCFLLYERKRGRGLGGGESFMGAYSTEQAAQDAAYAEYIAHFPGYVGGHFAPACK